MKKIVQLGDKKTTAYRSDELNIASALNTDCKTWFEAGSNFFGSDLTLFNRSNGQKVASTTANTNFTLDTSGATPLLVPATTANNYELGDIADEFSFIFVGKGKSAVLNRLFGYTGSFSPSTSGKLHSPHFYINALNRLEYNAVGTASPVAGVNLTSAQVSELAIYTVTFSTTKGLFIYRNGAVVASNTAFKTPLDYKTIALRTSISASIGHYIVANIDLSKDENAVKLKIVHDALKERYGII